MKFLLLIALLPCTQAAFAVEPGVVAPPPTAVQAAISVEQLIGKNLAAKGGEQAWRQVETMTMSGLMEVGKGMQVPYTIDLKRGRKSRVEIIFDQQTAVQVYDGTKGWKKRPFLGHSDVEPFTSDELQRAALAADLDGPLVDHVARGTKVVLEGSETIGGKDTYRLKLTLKSGQIRHLWLDKVTYLEAQIDGVRRLDGKERTTATRYGDYRSVHGLLLPFLFETSVVNEKASEKIVVQQVIINAPLNDSKFTTIL